MTVSIPGATRGLPSDSLGPPRSSRGRAVSAPGRRHEHHPLGRQKWTARGPGSWPCQSRCSSAASLLGVDTAAFSPAPHVASLFVCLCPNGSL